jgi:hypothetical protein
MFDRWMKRARHIYIYTYTNIYDMCVYIYTHMYIHTYIYINIDIDIYIYIHPKVCSYLWKYINAVELRIRTWISEDANQFCPHICMRERERECVCVCVCVQLSVRVCVCVYQRVCVREFWNYHQHAIVWKVPTHRAIHLLIIHTEACDFNYDILSGRKKH